MMVNTIVAGMPFLPILVAIKYATLSMFGGVLGTEAPLKCIAGSL